MTSKYFIIKNKLNQNLVYYPCPKNANSSVKLFISKHLNIDNKFYFFDDDIPKYQAIGDLKQYVETKKGNRVSLYVLMPSKQEFEKIDDSLKALKCCIIRNPIKRFISAYKNRILFHRDAEFKDYDIDKIIDNCLNLNFENKHFLPQSYFLGNDLNYYTFYSDIDNLDFFIKKINDFFEKKIKFPKLQTGGSDIKIELNQKQINKVKKIYKTDYDLLKTGKL